MGMDGAESLVRTLVAGGVDVCFANPGTSEMHFVAALDQIGGIRCVLGLFEGVAGGAADGYARMTDKPAATLFHCGPGLANALAALHNARRAAVPVVNIVGDQASFHRIQDPPLTADTEGWARGVSAWTRTTQTAASIGRDAALAIQAARSAPGQVATLIAPSDTCWGEGGAVGEPLQPAPPAQIDAHALTAVTRALRSGEPVLLLLGGHTLRARGLALAQAIAGKTGARFMAEQFNTRVEKGRGRPPIARVPYPIDLALAATAGFKHIVLIGALPPRAFFAHPRKPNLLYPDDATLHVLSRPEQDGVDALERLAEELAAKAQPAADGDRPAIAKGAIGPESFARTTAALLPDNAIVVDEAISFGRQFFSLMAHGAPHDWLQATMGGAIGHGIPLAVGAAIGAPGRRVVALQADGSAMYTLQGLWTQARENLDVTTVILSNRKYAVLLDELAHLGSTPGATASNLLDIGNPDLNWVRIAAGLGVEAARAETMEAYADVLSAGLRRPGPFLIELAI